MNYFYCVLLWISPVTVDIPDARRTRARLARFLAFVVLEEFHLAQALLGLFARLVRPAQIFAFLLGHNFVPGLHFFDHTLPSCMQFRAIRARLQYPCCCRRSRRSESFMAEVSAKPESLFQRAEPSPHIPA